ncbi:MAG: low molecular weight phosphotyrosine protein phosphatase [Gammaproteobacteria bacterium]|nr:low molecular weight phosphotyrosine protein phosphatase [Gammaproteobacteria bacterium]NNC66811.1 low molecular weight phosphotyrosine protein phosphatase [Gammaproteobacteria bacterium]
MANICRSPTAHGVFQKIVDNHDLNDFIVVDSAGTYAHRIGKKPDARAITAAAKRGYNLVGLRARKVTDADFEIFDYILAMDDENYADLTAQCRDEHKDKVRHFLEFATQAGVNEVPDPYYGGSQGFETVLDLVEEASLGLLKHIKTTHLPNSN